MILLGRDGDDLPRGQAATGHIGACLARDGSTGAQVSVDLDSAHAGLIVGKRGYGKSYTLAVLAEALADAPGTAPVVVDPMGAFDSLAPAVEGARHVASPTVRAGAVPPVAWPALLDLSPTGAAGGLVWRAAAEATTLAGMRDHVADADADPAPRRAADNHLRLAAEWGVFAPDGLTAGTVLAAPATVLDCTGLADAPANALLRALATGLYEACVDGDVSRLPWLLVDEAHAFFDGIARPALETVLTRGRAPGVSLVAATQRPGVLPEVAVSQSDLVVAHRLTAEADREALARARPAYATGSLTDRLPDAPGEAVVVDDATEAVHVVAVRERETPHDGDGARASETGAGGLADDADEGAGGSAEDAGDPSTPTSRE